MRRRCALQSRAPHCGPILWGKMGGFGMQCSTATVSWLQGCVALLCTCGHPSGRLGCRLMRACVAMHRVDAPAVRPAAGVCDRMCVWHSAGTHVFHMSWLRLVSGSPDTRPLVCSCAPCLVCVGIYVRSASVDTWGPLPPRIMTNALAAYSLVGRAGCDIA